MLNLGPKKDHNSQQSSYKYPSIQDPTPTMEQVKWLCVSVSKCTPQLMSQNELQTLNPSNQEKQNAFTWGRTLTFVGLIFCGHEVEGFLVEIQG